MGVDAGLSRILKVKEEVANFVDAMAIAVGVTKVLPQCNATRVPQIRYNPGASGIDDRLVMCMRNSAGTYEWRPLSGASVITGSIVAYSGLITPSGYLTCDGSSVSRTTYATLWSLLHTTVGTFTVTIASPGVFTLTAHGLTVGDMVYLNTTGALPTGLSQDVTYWVATTPTANTFTLATTLANALAGTRINTTGTQSGTHTITRTAVAIPSSTNFYLPDLRGNFIRGAYAIAGYNMGNEGGVEDVTLTSAQSGLPAHTHTQYQFTTNNNTQTGGSATRLQAVAANTGGPATGANSAANAASSHTNLPPYLNLHYIIKT